MTPSPPAARRPPLPVRAAVPAGPPGIGGLDLDDLAAIVAERGEPAVPGPPGRRRRLALAGGHVGRGHDAARRAPRRARRGLPLRHGRRAPSSARRRRPDREGAPPPRRRRARRVGPDALPGAAGPPRAAHAVHLEPGRLRGRLPVLRDRRARLRARPRRRPRSSTRSATPRAGWPPTGSRLTNIVFMGMGEPLLNLDRVLAAVEALNDPQRFGLGARHITVSTSGVVPGHPRG